MATEISPCRFLVGHYTCACHVIERACSAGKPIRVDPDAIKPIGTADYPTGR